MTAAKTTTPTTADELRAALATLEAQERAEQARQAALIRRGQAARAQKVFDAFPAIDDEMSEKGSAQYKEAIEAATRGDLNAAYAGFVGYLGSRSARARVRIEMQTAAHVLGIPAQTDAELAYRQLPFSDFIDSHLPKAVEANAADALAPYLVPEISDIETATAYLEAAGDTEDTTNSRW